MRFVTRSVGPWLAIVTLTAAGAAAAAGYGLTAPKRYRATAQLLVTPVPASDSTYTGLDLLRSGGKHTAAASAAALLRSPQVADAVRAQLGLTRSRDDLLSKVDAEPVDDSDVVAITVEDTSAAGAAQLANAFADALVSQRTASFQSQLVTTIRRDEQLLRTTKGTGADELRRRLAVLRSLQGQPDPTLRSAGQASAPASAVWPKLPRLIGIGAGIGFGAGVVLALLSMLARIGRGSRRPADDHRVPERLVDELESRLQRTVDELVTERERFTAREAALAVRERDVTAKLEELRAVVPEQHDDSFAEREEALNARIAALTQRELELAKRAGALAVRERELEAVRGPDQEEATAPAEREPEAEEPPGREAALAAQERELEERAAALAEREQELEAAEREPARLEAAEPLPAATDGARGRWNLTLLERLVEERGREFPDRLDEWSSYLYFLREYAEADGTVPASFDWLIQDTFSELVA